MEFCDNVQSTNTLRYCSSWPLRDPRMCAILSDWRTLPPIVCDYDLTSVSAFRLRAYITDCQTLRSIASLHLAFQHSIIVCISRGRGCGGPYRMLVRTNRKANQPHKIVVPRWWVLGDGLWQIIVVRGRLLHIKGVRHGTSLVS